MANPTITFPVPSAPAPSLGPQNPAGTGSHNFPNPSQGTQPPNTPVQAKGSVRVDYELPKTVSEVRNGWQWTCSSGAVVSGLLAASAAQLLSLFKGDNPASNLVVGLCYAAIFLNISATIGSFVITDSLGDVAYRSSVLQPPSIGSYEGSQSYLLKKYGVGMYWNLMLWHWLITFYCGIFSLILAVAIFVWQQETKGISIAMTVVVSLTVVPVVSFILLGVRRDQF